MFSATLFLFFSTLSHRIASNRIFVERKIPNFAAEIKEVNICVSGNKLVTLHNI